MSEAAREMQDFFNGKDDGTVQYVLDMRKGKDGSIEYLVRYNESFHLDHDVWEKASDLTCEQQIMAFYEGTNPKGLIPRLSGKDQAGTAGQSAAHPHILGIEQTAAGPMVRVQFPNEKDPQLISPSEMRDKFPQDMLAHFEKVTHT